MIMFMDSQNFFFFAIFTINPKQISSSIGVKKDDQ